MVIPLALIFLCQILWNQVSGAAVSWSRSITTGILSHTSSICTSYDAFRRSLIGFKTTAFVVRAGSTVRRCDNPVIAKQLTDSFSSTGTTSSIVCDGTAWRMEKCGSGIEISIATGNTAPRCQCSSADLVIRPCIGNSNWGGVGANICGSISTTLTIIIYDDSTTPTTYPTSSPTKTPIHPTLSPTETPTASPTATPTSLTPTSSPSNAGLFNDFVIIDQNGDGSLNYDEIAFAIADTSKDEKVSREEYEAARDDRIFIDTSYSLIISNEIDYITDFDIIDKNDDGVLNYDEIAYAIADTNKDGKLSFEEYEAARADRIFIDSSYMLK